MMGAIVGFFIWNYPRELIFLGDGGSYLICLDRRAQCAARLASSGNFAMVRAHGQWLPYL